jgi:PAS domain S-box-containing protein
MRSGFPGLTWSSIKACIVFVVAAGLWTLISDHFLTVFFSDPKTIRWVATLKDLLFVIATALVLFWVARRGGSVIENSESRLRRIDRAVKTLSGCNQALFRSKDESSLMKEICRIIVEVGGYRLAWVGLAGQDEEKSIQPGAQWGYEDGYLEKLNLTWADTERGRSPTGNAIRTGLPSVVQNIKTGPPAAFWRDEALKRRFASTVSLPLMDGDKPFGSLGIYAEEPDAFGTEELKLLKELADDLSIGILTFRLRTQSEQEEKARLLLATACEQLEECIAIFDSHGIVQYANLSLERISGHDRKAIAGRNVCDLSDGETNDQFFKAMAEAVARSEPWSGRFTVGSYKNGAMLEINARVSPLRDAAGNITDYVFVGRDVSQQERLEKQLRQAQKMEALGTLAGGIAHDFNNILGAIISCAEFALEDALPGSPTREDLGHVLKASYRGKNLIKQILAFSRTNEQERRPTEIVPLVKECLKFLRASLPSSIEIRQNISAGPVMVLADPTQIHQVILNLCTNAAHAMREKGGILEVSLSEVTAGPSTTALLQNVGTGAFIRLAVTDTGHGMSKKIMERIFDPFFTTKKQGEGTGLGLSMVHGIIMNYGGDITVSSERGKGTTFEVFLPCMECSGDLPEVSKRAIVSRGSERILFVDDEEDLVYAGEKMLKRLGYEPVVFQDALAALQAFRTNPDKFDLIITDQSMPHVTGIELAREAQRMRPGIPIILCSGFSPEAGEGLTVKEAEQAGIREVKMKPIGSSEMAEAIRKILDEKHS